MINMRIACLFSNRNEISARIQNAVYSVIKLQKPKAYKQRQQMRNHAIPEHWWEVPRGLNYCGYFPYT